MNQSQTSLVNPSNPHIPYSYWFILSIDLVSVTFYTIPTSIYFSKKKFIVFYVLCKKRTYSTCTSSVLCTNLGKRRTRQTQSRGLQLCYLEVCQRHDANRYPIRFGLMLRATYLSPGDCYQVTRSSVTESTCQATS